MKYCLMPILLFSFFQAQGAETSKLKLSLNDVMKMSFDYSPSIRAQKKSTEAAELSAEAVKARGLPSLSIEGSYRQVSEVSTIELPGGNKIEMGDKKNYSIGPVLKWVLWDSGQIQKSFESLKSIEASQRYDLEVTKRQTTLQTRLAYYKVQYALEQQVLIFDSLKLAQSQYNDILKRKNAGAASRLDLLSAHQEVINLKKAFNQLQGDLAQLIRELYNLLGKEQKEDFSVPLNYQISDYQVLLDSKPTVLLDFDSLEKTLNQMVIDETNVFASKENPIYQSSQKKLESARAQSESLSAGHWPQLSLQAKTTRDYPNTPIKEEYQQNTLALSLNIPIWEWGRVKNEVQSQNAKGKAIEEQTQQVLASLEKEYVQAKEQIINLKEQKKLNQKAVQETDEIAQLTYQDYKAGRLNITEVLRSNVQSLSAKVNEAQTTMQLLVQKAKLASLVKTEEF